MNNADATLMCGLSELLSDVDQNRKIYIMEQFILNLMDYTEQTDDEKLWCDLYSSFQELKKKYEENKV